MMRRVLVTGATGFIGSNLIRALTGKGIEVIALRRESSRTTVSMNKLLQYRTGDIRESESILRAIDGCDTVFHTAAVVSFWRAKRTKQLEVNVGGTRNIVEACLKTGVQKLVHTSSVAALGFRTDRKLIDETTAYNWGSNIGYKYSKHLAELEILEGVGRGLNAVLVNPTVVVGPGDLNMHGGALVCDIARGNIPAYSSGGMNLVSIQSVVAGHLAAAERGLPGERYILGGTNFTHKEAFGFIANVLRKSSPRFWSPVFVTKSVARVLDAVGRITGKEPWITSELVSGLGLFNWYSCAKAHQELGYLPTSLEEAILEAYNWYSSNGMA